MLKKILCVLCLLVMTSCLYAKERITYFTSSMQVHPDGSATVIEDISIVAEHNKIRRGIYRDLPDRLGEHVHDFSLWMDGAVHPFFTERKGSLRRVNFGDDSFLEQGAHTYRFTYTIDNVVRLFRNHDEIYWNVTGSGWDFPIEQAYFHLTLPDGAHVNQGDIASYVGSAGSKGNPAKQQGLSFWAGRTINPGEDFTVAIPWQKGIITPQASYYLRYLVFVLLIGGILLLWLYYWWAWNQVGRDPQARIIPQYEPPEGFSAVKMLYVYTMGTAKHLLLPTTIVSLTMKEALAIEKEKGFFTESTYLVRKSGLSSPIISPEEAFVYPALFTGKDKVKLGDKKNAATFSTISNELDVILKKESDKYFTNNTRYNVPTFVYLILGSLLIFGWNLEPLIMGTFLLIIIMLVVYATQQNRVSLVNQIASYLYPSVLACSCLFFLLDDKWMALAYSILCMAAVVGGLFMHWIKAYTIFGREVMDHIDGFKRYMEIGEGGRVALSDPTDALRIFCDYLPYAYALGVESKWMKHFEKQFSAQQLSSALSHRGFHGISPSNFASSINSTFSSLSSGAGGGGHAGGGSGGGGGGGR